MYLDKNIKIINNEKEFSFFDNKRKSFNCYPIKVNLSSIIEKNVFLNDSPLILTSSYSDGTTLENIFINLLNCKNFIVPKDTLFDIQKTSFFVNNKITITNFLTLSEENSLLIVDSQCDMIDIENYNKDFSTDSKIKISDVESISSVILKRSLKETKYVNLNNIKYIKVYSFSVKNGESSLIKIPKNIFKNYEFLFFISRYTGDRYYLFPGILTGNEQNDESSVKFEYTSLIFNITSYANDDYMKLYFEQFYDYLNYNAWSGKRTWNSDLSFTIYAYNIIDGNWN